MAFWRRSRGRHALGAAVRSLPSAPPPAPVLATPVPMPPAPVEPAPVVAPVLVPPAALAPAPVAPPLDWSFPELAPPSAPVAPVAPGPRVELTFRDGSSTSLDPEQARALEEIAQVLTRRD